ncbi:hypothetical protein WK57_17365 [Burkholderia ubonensis]|uniref:Uncharacterized protein n=1 Tax=Burkholderia ubonensis TaxID=101571 RepID=A0AA40R8D7_9BURK|nr:hypothetical protein WK57_17365 [Burkholderia ubonensis]
MAACESPRRTPRRAWRSPGCRQADDDTPANWLLEVIGKGKKQRFVPVSDECVDALRAHWGDRGEAFDAVAADGASGLPLIAPLVVPPTPRAREKFGGWPAPATTP